MTDRVGFRGGTLGLEGVYCTKLKVYKSEGGIISHWFLHKPD